MSVLLVEIDRFRQISDSFGRLAGDLVLRECAERIGRASPVGGPSGRYSGEEFSGGFAGIRPAGSGAGGEPIRAGHRLRIRFKPGQPPSR